jgi:hypothetical protein
MERRLALTGSLAVPLNVPQDPPEITGDSVAAWVGSLFSTGVDSWAGADAWVSADCGACAGALSELDELAALVALDAEADDAEASLKCPALGA